MVHRSDPSDGARDRAGYNNGRTGRYRGHAHFGTWRDLAVPGLRAAGHPPFPAWTCISVNEEIVHGVPGRRVMKEGDIVTVDICAELNGWIADSAWTFPRGQGLAAGRTAAQGDARGAVSRDRAGAGRARVRATSATRCSGTRKSHGFSVVRELQGMASADRCTRAS